MDDIDRPDIEEVRAGNTRRFAGIVDRHRDRAMTLALRLLGSREEAEEAVQDAFVRSYRGLGRFRGDSHFSTWFYRILYNLCLTRMRRRGPEPEEPAAVENLAEAEDSSALNILEEREIETILQEETDRLPPAYKNVLLLFYIQEMRYEEIAVVLELPLGTVKTHLFRARALLKKKVLMRTEEVHSL